MRVRCDCGREGILNRPGKRKNCRQCGADLRDAKAVEPVEVALKAGRRPKRQREIKTVRGLRKAYPDLCTELAAHGAQEARAAIAAMSAAEFHAAFPELAEQIAQDTVAAVAGLSTEEFREAFGELADRLGVSAEPQPEPAAEGDGAKPPVEPTAGEKTTPEAGSKEGAVGNNGQK